jgi:hypothetical protein
MAKLAELRKKAKEMGIAPSLIRGATTATELQEIIEDNKPAKSKSKVGKKSRGKAKVSSTSKRNSKTNSKSKSASSKSAPAANKSKGKAKRPTTAKNDSGRNLLGKINYNDDEDWNPREGSPPDRIVKALKKFKGDREKVFNLLKKDVWDFVGKRMKDGSKRKLRGDKWGAEEMLRYRIARTDWDFAMRTGQHDKSENRVEYGEGGTGEGIYNGKSKAKARSSKAAGSSKRGKASASKTKTTTKGKASTKGKTTAKRGPGRPKGSKNKKK